MYVDLVLKQNWCLFTINTFFDTTNEAQTYIFAKSTSNVFHYINAATITKRKCECCALLLNSSLTIYTGVNFNDVLVGIGIFVFQSCSFV
jgi:hypothetical protein